MLLLLLLLLLLLSQVDRRDWGEGFRHKSPQRDAGTRRDARREKSQSEPERGGGGGNKGRNAVFAAQKLVRGREGGKVGNILGS